MDAFSNIHQNMQSPIFIPTTINCLFENIDAIDVAAANISCTNLTVDGEPISTFVQNIDEVTVGSTTFTGSLRSDSLQVSGSIFTSGPILQTSDGSLAVLKTLSATSIESSGNITQTTGTTSLQELTVEGNITQTSGFAVLPTLTVDSMICTGTASLYTIATGDNLQLSFTRNPVAGELGHKTSGTFTALPTIVSGLNTISPLASMTISDPGTYQFYAAVALNRTGTTVTVNRLEVFTSINNTFNMINVASIGNQIVDTNNPLTKVQVTHTETILTVPVERYCSTVFHLSSNAASINTDGRNLYFYAIKIA